MIGCLILVGVAWLVDYIITSASVCIFIYLYGVSIYTVPVLTLIHVSLTFDCMSFFSICELARFNILCLP